MGETDKFVPLSPQRFTDIQVRNDTILMTLKGSPGEDVAVTVLVDMISRGTCYADIGMDGTATVSSIDCFN